jgi:CHAT domain-containing protein
MKRFYQFYLLSLVFLPALVLAIPSQSAFEYFQQGHFELATQKWEKMWHSPKECTELSIDDLVLFAQAYQHLGKLREAFSVLQPFITQPNLLQTVDPIGYANVFKQLSEIYLALGDLAVNQLKVSIPSCKIGLKAQLNSNKATTASSLPQSVSQEVTYWLNTLQELPQKILQLLSENKQSDNEIIKICPQEIQVTPKLENLIHALISIQMATESLAQTSEPVFLANILNTKGNVWSVVAQLDAEETNTIKETLAQLTEPPNIIQAIEKAISTPMETALVAYQEGIQFSQGDQVLRAKLLVNLVKAKLVKAKANCQAKMFLPAKPTPSNDCSQPTENLINNSCCENHLLADSIKDEFAKALQQVNQLSNHSYDKAVALIDLARILQPSLFDSANCSPLAVEARKQVRQILTVALKVAKNLANNMLIAYAQSYLAQSYAEETQNYGNKQHDNERTSNYDKAIHLTQEAIHYVQLPKFQQNLNSAGEKTITITQGDKYWFTPLPNKESLIHCSPEHLALTNYSPENSVLINNSPELFYLLEWQLGKFLAARGKLQEAVAAYQRAVKYLELFRYGYRLGYQSFRDQKAEQLHLELADLLLLQAAQQQSIEAKKPLLTQARDTIELLKKVELQNYFQDECITENNEEIDKLATQSLGEATAILYPIILPQRLELLLSLPNDKLKQFTHNQVTDKEIQVEAKKFRKELQTLPNLKCLGEDDDPDKSLLPSAQNFYKWLIEPIINILELKKIDTLIIVPQGILHTISFAALHDGENYLVKRLAVVIIPGWNLTKSQRIEIGRIKALLGGSEKFLIPSSEFPDLNNASEELDKIQNIFNKNNILMNNDFNIYNIKSNLEKALYSIIHLATHGKFNKNINDTFLLTHKEKITLDCLETLIDITVWQNKPVELLTLSACETALGDERAALGLAGVALKTGVQSVLATLWEVREVTTADIMSSFYQKLHDNYQFSKAVALQKAQIEILSKYEYEHPYFWAPFVLIGNWE